MKALFGPAVNSDSFYAEGYDGTLAAAKWVKEKGLDIYEYSFGRGYRMSFETARQIGQEFERQGIELSIHAPYFINFASQDSELLAKTYGYITTGLKFLKEFKGSRLVFHPGSEGNLSREQAFLLTKSRIGELANNLEKQGLLEGVYLCPETMGKTKQIGTYEEILQICAQNSHLLPTFDFGHINALTQGSLKTKDDFVKIFARSIELIGRERTEKCHIHFSKIEYGSKGEIRHLTFEDELYGPDFQPLCDALISLGLSPHIICESSGKMAEDALEMKEIYQKTLGKKSKL